MGSRWDVRFRVVRDPQEVERLERGKKVKRYRAMQLIDGKLYPPMSARVNGQLRELGVWEQADENHELARNGKFRLDMGQKGQGTVDVAYNPYFHTSTDQFSSAWKRPELVVVEVEIPESELTSGYRAAGAKDSVGDTDWKSGSVNNALPADRQRTVTLSRWMKAVRIVPDAEVADMIARQLEGTDIAVPFNVVNENLRGELVKRGVRIGEPEDSNAGRASRAAYEQWRNEAAENYEGLTIKSALGRNSSGEIAPSLVNSGAKLDNASDIHKGLDDISAKITQTGSLGGHELLYGIAQAFGFKGINLNHSKYFDIGHGAQLRIADRYGSVDEHNRRGRTTDNYGFVIKLSSNKFRSDPSVDYFEAVYYPDRITNPNRQQAIINGLKRFVDTGDFTELALPDRINPSGKWREVFPWSVGARTPVPSSWRPGGSAVRTASGDMRRGI